MGHNGPMLTMRDIEGLEPTRTERPVVDAVKEHGHAGWPHVYLALKAVSKEDLEADADYTERHPRPSVTQFVEECALLSGQGKAMLWKYIRAGEFYESLLGRPACELPPVTDARVCAVSPDTLILVDRVARLLLKSEVGRDGSAMDLLALLVSELLEGRGLARRDLKAWIDRLSDAERSGELDACASSFAVHAARKVGGAAVPARPRTKGLNKIPSLITIPMVPLTSELRPLLAESLWLTELARSGERPATWRVNLFDSPRLRVGEGRLVTPDFVVAETLTGDMSVHLVEVKSGTAPAGVSLERLDSYLACGADYVWVAVEEEHVERYAGGAQRLGCGVLAYDGKKLRVAVAAKRQDVGPEERCALYRELLKCALRRTNRETVIEYSISKLEL